MGLLLMLSLLTPPSIEPLTVQELLDHLRIDVANQEPAPHIGPTAALASAAAAGNVDNGAHRYAVTFVDADGGETEPSPLSAAVTVADKTVNGQVALTAIPTGGARIVSRKLYRTKANADTLFFLATLANNTATTSTDSTADTALGAEAPSANTTTDPTIADLIVDARARVEDVTGRQLLEAEYRLDRPGWPSDGFIELPRPPCLEVPSVKYIAADGTLTTLAPSQYLVTAPSGPYARAGRITPAYGVTWPSVQPQANAVQVTFLAGYGTTRADVPGTIKRAMKLIAGTYYEQRENDVLEKNTTALPVLSLRVKTILAPYRWRPETRQVA